MPCSELYPRIPKLIRPQPAGLDGVASLQEQSTVGTCSSSLTATGFSYLAILWTLLTFLLTWSAGQHCCAYSVL